MTVTEKVAYLKGLAEGLNVAEDTKEGKLLKAIMDVLTDMAADLEDVRDCTAELTEQVDAIDEDLDQLEMDYYEDYEDYDDCDCDCCDDDEELYEIECPACHDTVYLDEDMLSEDGITCPNCGTELEFDFDGCDCGCCHGDESDTDGDEKE